MHTLDHKAPVPLREMLAAVFSRRKQILYALAVPPLLGLLGIIVLAPVYRAQTQLLFKTGREYLPQTEAGGSPAGPTSTKQEAINSEIELLMSRSVIEKTINTIGLRNLYPGIVDNPPWQGSPMDAAVKKFTNSVITDPVKMSNVVNVTFDDTDKARSSRVLDTLVRVYLAKHTEVFATGRSHSYQDTIDRSQQELQNLEQQQARIKVDNRIYDINVQRTALIQQRVEAQNHLQEDRDRRNTLQQRVTYLAHAKSSVPTNTMSSETDRNDQMDHARNALTDLQQQESALLARLSPQNPEVQRIHAQIEGLQGNISQLHGTLTRVSSAPTPLAQQVSQELVMDQAELAPLADEIGRYEGLVQGFGAELSRLEQADTQLRVTQNRITSLQDNIRDLQQHYDQARTEDDLDQARMTSVVQVAPAMTPDKPAKPSHVMFLAGGIFLGLLAAGGVAVMAVTTRSRFFTEIGIENQLGVPVLASVALLRPAETRLKLAV